MATYSDLKGRIATDLTRTDLTSQIANAASDAIKFYQGERFWFNTSRSLTLTTVTGTADYVGSTSIASGVTVADLVKIDAMFCPSGNSKIPMARYEAPDFEMLVNATSSQALPVAFTYIDETLRLWPTPDTVYAIIVHAHYNLAVPGDGDSTAWTNAAEELIRSHAKLLLYTDLLEDTEGASRMGSKIPVLLGNLRVKSSSRSSTGIIQGTQF